MSKQELYDDYKKQWPDLDIQHLIISTKNYIVFIDSDLDVDWLTSKKYDSKGHADLERYNKILNYSAEMECIPNDHHDEKIRLNYKRMIGEAIARALDDDYQNAEEMLKKASKYIYDRNVETSRYWYLLASSISGVFCIIISLGLWIFRNFSNEVLGINGLYLCIFSLAGGIGALLSITQRIGKSTLNCESGKNLHYLEGFSRILAGIISALFISLLIKSGYILPIIKSSPNMNLAILFVSIFSGASERLAPSIITQMDKNKNMLSEMEGK
jgi:hypothetical protein